MNTAQIILISNTIMDTLEERQKSTPPPPQITEDINKIALSIWIKNDEIERNRKKRPLQHTVLQRAFCMDVRRHLFETTTTNFNSNFNFNSNPNPVDCWLIGDFCVDMPLKDFISGPVYDPVAFWCALAHTKTILGSGYKIGWLHNQLDEFVRVYVYKPYSTTWLKIKQSHADLGFIAEEE